MVDLGKLKPGVTYIYERHDGIIYAREFGGNPNERFVVGYESPQDYERLSGVKEDKLWAKIRQTAKTNPALQEALDRVKVLYELTKDER